MNGFPFTIIGVTQPGFTGVSLASSPQIWVPIVMQAQVEPEFASEQVLAERRISWLDMVGRLRPGVTIEQAQARLDTIATRRAAGQPPDQRDPRPLVVPAASAAVDPYGTEGSARISRLLKDEQFRRRLMEAPDATALFQTIREEDDKY